MANDSSVAVKDQNLTAQMAASYQYRSFQQLAQQKEREANEVRIVLTLLIAAVIILFMLGIFLWLRYRERQRYRLQTMRKEYADATHSYNQNLHTLQVLQDSHKSIIQQMQQKLSSSEAENRHYREKKNQLEQLTAQYETEHLELIAENNQLKARIEQLRQQLNPRPDAASSTLFGDTPIAQRIAELHDMPQVQLTDAEKEALVLAASQHFPDMVQALRQAKDIDQEGAVICILVALNQKPGDIRNMLNLSFQQVSNQKSAINTALFGDSSARSLYKNLINHFAIYQG
jgi:predicted RNase H-like nuclease (RuvC/YqgF family)